MDSPAFGAVDSATGRRGPEEVTVPTRQLAGLVVLWSLSAASTAPAQDLGEVRNLRWCEGTKDCLEWDALAGATGYLVHRGEASTLALLGTDEIDSCIAAQPRGTATGRVLSDDPPPSSLHWFLVTANEESDPGAGRRLDTSGPCCAARVVDEGFADGDGASWPAGWTELGSVDVAEQRGGMAALRPTPSNYSLARMGLAGDWRNVEVTFALRFEDLATQGVGLYVRQDGSYLDPASPAAGYVVFVEGFRGDGIGLWKEQDGSEISLDIRFDPALGLEDGVRYRVRFRCMQVSPTTTDLRAKIWREGDPEPTAWDIALQDSSPEQQNRSGGIAVDSWSSIQAPGTISAFTAVDELVVTPLCNPLEGIAPVGTLSEAFTFTEGPAWSGSELYFSDVQASIVHRLELPGSFSEWRNPSAAANGLVVEPGGAVLACEHGSRSVTRTHPDGTTETVVADWMGSRFNSPNDLARRSDGTLYFTDPPYGLADPGLREIPFNGLFRLDPAGELFVEWMGDPDATRPNGVVLSPGEGVLYVADSQPGTVLAFPVNPDGSLGPPWTLATGLNTPDGMAVDRRGNLFVATWASTVEVFAPNGGRWGSIAIPRPATNCTFGGAALDTLFVTAQEGLHSLPLPIPGVPPR